MTLLCLLRATSPVIASQTPYIQAFVSQLLHYPVKMQRVYLSWYQLHPSINIQNIQLEQGNIGHLIFSISLIPSVLHQKVFCNHVVIDSANISIKPETGVLLTPSLFAQLIPKKSHILIEVKHSLINLPHIFNAPVDIQAFKAQLSYNNNNHRLYVQHLTAHNAVIALTGFITLSEQYADICLGYRVNDQLVPSLSHYLPINHTVLSEDLRYWLLQSIRHLDKASGEFVFQGNFQDFPFITHTGKFSVTANIQNAELHYDSQWPIADHLNAQLVFTSKGMEAKSVSGTIAGVHLSDFSVGIPEWQNSLLVINGKAVTDIKSLLNFVLHSPLQKKISRYFNALDIQAKTELALNLIIPLEKNQQKTQKTLLKSLLIFSKNHHNTLKLIFSDADNIQVDNLQGRIFLTESGLVGEKLTGILNTLPITLDVFPSRYLVHYGKWQVTVLPELPDDAQWVIHLVHPDIKGLLKVTSSSPVKIKGTLDYVFISSVSGLSGSPIQKSAKLENYKIYHPEKIPNLAVTIRDFQYHQKKFGQVNFITRPAKDRLILNRLTANLPETDIRFSGYGKKNFSAINGTADSKNLRETFKNWQLPDIIDSESAHLSYQINWQNSLYLPDLKTLQGNFFLNIQQGRLFNITTDSKMNLGKLLTLLSFQSFERRLKLDFSDLTQQGLNFDRITGQFSLQKGVAMTENTTLEGPLTHIQLLGKIDIVRQQYHLTVLVTPHLTSSLPIAATLVGGPIAGAATWVANQLLNPVLNKMTSDRYTVTGSWDNPIIHSL